MTTTISKLVMDKKFYRGSIKKSHNIRILLSNRGLTRKCLSKFPLAFRQLIITSSEGDEDELISYRYRKEVGILSRFTYSGYLNDLASNQYIKPNEILSIYRYAIESKTPVSVSHINLVNLDEYIIPLYVLLDHTYIITNLDYDIYIDWNIVLKFIKDDNTRLADMDDKSLAKYLTDKVTLYENPRNRKYDPKYYYNLIRIISVNASNNYIKLFEECRFPWSKLHLSMNKNLTDELIELLDDRLDTDLLLCNQYININSIVKYRSIHNDNIRLLLSRLDIDLEWIISKIGCGYAYGKRNVPNLNTEGWSVLSANPIITWNIIKEHNDLPWDINALFRNPSLTYDNIIEIDPIDKKELLRNNFEFDSRMTILNRILLSNRNNGTLIIRMLDSIIPSVITNIIIEYLYYR